MTDTSYVRTAMLPAQKPPASETGVVHWEIGRAHV